MGRFSARCGVLEVPENRTDSSGRTITFRVAVVPASNSESKLEDPVLVLDGAPGATVMTRAPRHIVNFGEILNHRDLVFVEQRGTGESSALDCGLDLDSLEPSAVAECRERLGRRADLRFYGSHDAAADLADAIGALGYEQVNVFAQSHATRTAIELVRRHPERVRTLTLLGTYPPGRNAVADAPALLDRSLDLVVAACHASMVCRGAYPELRDQLARLPERLDAGALGISRTEAALDLRRLLLTSLTSKTVPRVVAALAGGDRSPLDSASRSASEEADEISDGAFLSVLCAEDVARLEPPLEGEPVNRTLLPPSWSQGLREICREWPSSEMPADFHSPVEVETPILSLTGELDPTVDPVWGAELAASTRAARHFTIPRAQHRLRGLRGLGCVLDLVREFIDVGAARGLDASCLSGVRALEFDLPAPRER